MLIKLWFCILVKCNYFNLMMLLKSETMERCMDDGHKGCDIKVAIINSLLNYAAIESQIYWSAQQKESVLASATKN